MDDATLSRPIRIVGADAVRLAPADVASLPTAERRIEVVCDSGDRWEARWRGVPFPALVDRASVPDDTTHLLVESADGYRVCVDVPTALDGLLALARDGRALSDVEPYESRFLAPGLPGPRTVKDVVRVEAVRLEPGADPDAYEDLKL